MKQNFKITVPLGTILPAEVSIDVNIPDPVISSQFTQAPATETHTITGGQTPPIPPDPTTGTTSFVGSWNKSIGGFDTPNLGDPARAVQSGVTWHNIPAAKITITPGDNNTANSRCACDPGDCERSEVAELPDGKGGLIDESKAIGTTVYFGTSYKIPSAYASTPKAAWYILLQLHSEITPGTNPLFAFDINGKKWQVNFRPNTETANTGLSLSNNAIVYDKWTDFVFAINFQKSATGSITVWRRDEGQTKFTQVLSKTGIQTLQTKGTAGVTYHYWKQGVYRGHTNSTDVMFMGNFVRATTFSAAEQAAFNTNNGF